MIVMPEPKFRVGRSGGCDRWIGSQVRPSPGQVVDLARTTPDCRAGDGNRRAIYSSLA
jgi:hypothetical protein